jgi:two-component system phosphate regulon sensor histidine kinase PhoR
VPLAVSTAVFGGLWLTGLLGLVSALVSFVIVAAATIVAGANPDANSLAARQQEALDPPPNDAAIETVLKGLPSPAVALGRRDEIIAFNSLARAIAPALLPREHISMALRTPQILEAIRRARSTGTAQLAEFLDRGATDRWYELVASPVVTSRPASDLLLLIFHDLTPLRRVEEMRADFVANASHELRTPLAALSGFIETLQGSARDDGASRDRFLAIMRTQATRMARLIDDLLSLSRIELNEHLRPDKELDLIGIIRQVVDTLQTLARDRGVEVEVTTPAGPVLVLGIRDELIRVFENLLENALKYGATGKRVVLTLSPGDPGRGQRDIRVAVRDFGPGIAPEHLPRLTERFYRVDVATSRTQGGTGLGLALVKHILNRHGGRLVIESTLGSGATFTAVIPARNPPEN